MNTSLSVEGGLYHVQHITDALQENWLLLCRDVTQAHHLIRQKPETTGYHNLTICEMSGNTPLRYDDSLIGLGVIAFNGCSALQLAGEPFVLHRLRRTIDRYSCHTYGHPYNFLVQVTFLLALHHCPNAWKIKTNVPINQWRQAMEWIAKYLGSSVSTSDTPENNIQNRENWDSWFNGQNVTLDFMPERDLPEEQTRDDH